MPPFWTGPYLQRNTFQLGLVLTYAGDWPADGGLSGLNLGLLHLLSPSRYSPSVPAPYSAQDLDPALVPTQGKTPALHKGVFTEPVKLLNFNPTKKSIF